MQQWLKVILFLSILLSQACLAAAQPISLTIRNTTNLDLQLDRTRLFASNINLDDLRQLREQIIYGRSVSTVVLRTTGEPAELLLTFRSTQTEPGQTSVVLGQWGYVESQNVVNGCHNVHGNQSFNIACVSNNNLLQLQVILTLGDPSNYISNNINALSLSVINNADHDINISPSIVKNMESSDIQRLTGAKVYAGKQTTFLVDRQAHPAHLHLIFFTSEAEGSASSLKVGEWEYVEADNIAEPCHKIIPIYPYNIDCNGTSDIENPSASITINAKNSQPFPRAR